MALISMVEIHDARALVRISGEAAAAREDPRKWPRVLLESARKLLSAHVVLLAEIEMIEGLPRIAAFWVEGAWDATQREAFVDELQLPQVADPLLVRLVRRLEAGQRRTMTAARQELIPDELWEGADATKRLREECGLDECIGSVTQLAWRGWHMGLVAYRRVEHGAAFGDREWTLLETLHEEMTWIYDAELQRRPAHISMLTPRMAETLRHLVAGRDEREAAIEMNLSPHTVHGYVKALHRHFGVSTRQDLIERWTRLNSAKQRK